jgi:hypothetical protein
MPVQRDGQGQCLDRESGGDPPVGECLADRLGDAEIGEGGLSYVLGAQSLGSVRLRNQSFSFSR